jgi:23S rRNA pseudouridine1911/1915/1917 synthase
MLTHPPYENHIIAENIPLNIVYEDDAFVVD